MDTPTPAAGKKILCVEDEFFISELYTRALTKAGYDVTVIVDGDKGLEAALTDEYDIIMLDIMVPNMLGVDILQSLRTKKSDLRARIIITTNLDEGEQRRAHTEGLADGYLIKAEVTPRQLVEYIANLR